MSRRPHPSQRFMTHAQDASRNDVLQTETSKSLRQVLRAARATGALALAGRRLRELPVESYAPTPDDLDEGEKFWEIVELKSFDCSHNKLDELPSDWRAISTLRQLRVARNQLGMLPEALLSDLPALELLDAGDNRLRSLPPVPAAGCALKTLLAPRNALEKLERWNVGECLTLETLSLSDNEGIKVLPALPKPLRALDVENCGLQHLQPTQFLETLAAARNKLKGVDVGGLQKLKYLDLRQNDLPGVLNLPSLPALAELFLGHNQLKQFDLKPSPVLATIEVSSNSLQKLPESLGRCINLRALDASNNDLAELPCSLGTLPKLQRIALDGNPLRSVRRDVIERGCEAIKAFLRTRAATPAERHGDDDGFDPLALANRVRDPDARGVLNLAGKHLRHWPLDRDVCAKVRESLEQDEGLDAYVDDGQKAARTARVKSVDVSENALSELPEASCLLALGDSLRELKCSRNRLRQPPLLSLANVPLKVLDASRNEITNDDADTPLPDACALARNLSELDLSGNRLLRIPRSLFGLQALRSVTLARNELSGDLGRGWASLLALEALNLADNRLGALGDVHKAPVLRTLDLGNNCLRSVPPELGLCDCLRSLILHGNPQRAIRAETLPKDTLKVLARLRDRLPMDVVERHLKREEDLQSIEDSHESFEERYTSPPPPTGPPPKTGYGSTPPPPDGPPPVLSDYAPPSAAARLSSAVDNRACRAMAWSPAPGQGRAMAWSPQDGSREERKKKPVQREKKRKPFESVRAPRPVLSLPSPVLGKGVLPRQSPRPPEKELKPSNRPPAIGRSSKPTIAPEDTITLKGLNERVSSLDQRLTEDGASLSQAKVYALKKQLARAKADRIRFERQLAAEPDT